MYNNENYFDYIAYTIVKIVISTMVGVALSGLFFAGLIGSINIVYYITLALRNNWYSLCNFFFFMWKN